MVLILDGRKVRDEIAKALREKIAAFSSAPTLAIVQVGARPESDAYIGRKKKFGETIGARVEHIRVSEGTGVDEIRAAIEKLDKDAAVHGIILQLPVPSRFNRQRLIDAIAPEKDADGLTTKQVNARKAGRADAVIPATARGVIELLEFYQIPIRGKRAAVLGRSALVGAPAAEALRQRGAEVAICHSQTANTKDVTRASDIIVVAIGKPRLVGREYFKDDNTQTVVDVGITAVTEKGTERLEEEIPNDELVGLDRPGGAVGRTNLKRFVIGDVDFDAVRDMVAAISPVPGGVGPMTVAALFENLVDSML